MRTVVIKFPNVTPQKDQIILPVDKQVKQMSSA